MDITQLKGIELFAGSRSVGKVAENMGMEIFSVDWSNFEGIHLSKDIGLLELSDVPFIPGFAWASPDCTTYTIAAISHHRDGILPKSDYAAKCDEVNRHFISLFKKWLSVNLDFVFFIENPRGMLRKMPFMQEFTRHTVWYCQYGADRASPPTSGPTRKHGCPARCASTGTPIVRINARLVVPKRVRKGGKEAINAP